MDVEGTGHAPTMSLTAQMSARLDGVNGQMAGVTEAIRQKQQQLDMFEERKAAIDQQASSIVSALRAGIKPKVNTWAAVCEHVCIAPLPFCYPARGATMPCCLLLTDTTCLLGQIAACNVKRVDIKRAEERQEETSQAAKTAEKNLQDVNQMAQMATLDGDLQGIANTIRQLREVLPVQRQTCGCCIHSCDQRFHASNVFALCLDLTGMCTFNTGTDVSSCDLGAVCRSATGCRRPARPPPG
jgi:hypothetical protein